MEKRNILKKKLNTIQYEGGLCAKWQKRKGAKAIELRTFLDFTPKRYRKTLVDLTNVVESKMCAKDWNSIEFGKLPSIASARYRKAFLKNASEKYKEYLERLEKGEEKVNAGAIFPHDVLKSLISSYGWNNLESAEITFIREQWNALPNFLGDDNILPLVDVSGSMEMAKISGNTTPLDVAVSLGLYIADKQKGAFSDMWLNFSDKPRIRELKGDVISKVNQMTRDHDWGQNTNIEAAFGEILRVATTNDVSSDEMPKYLLILSDMEFDHCVRDGNSVTAYTNASEQFEKAGYELPKVVFWNLNGRQGNVPVKHDENGTALISGYSPSILKSVLKASNFNPEDIMLGTVMVPRYSIFE
jgi:hypothetical protein